MNQVNVVKVNRKYEVYDKLNEICSPIFGQLYHIDLLYITTYIFRICKIKDMLTRNDKRSKYALLAHLEQLKKNILPIISQKEMQTALLDSVYKERCLCRGQKPFPGAFTKSNKNKNHDTKDEQNNEEKTSNDKEKSQEDEQIVESRPEKENQNKESKTGKQENS